MHTNDMVYPQGGKKIPTPKSDAFDDRIMGWLQKPEHVAALLDALKAEQERREANKHTTSDQILGEV